MCCFGFKVNSDNVYDARTTVSNKAIFFLVLVAKKMSARKTKTIIITRRIEFVLLVTVEIEKKRRHVLKKVFLPTATRDTRFVVIKVIYVSSIYRMCV